MGLNWLDYLVIIIYSVGLLGLGFLFKNQKDKKDYFLGGRSFGWFSMGMSTMASQLSAISFISAAAFVGMKVGGGNGLQWLSYEFAVPLAMIFLLVVLIPPLYNAGVVSIYSYLEKRFGSSTRTLISIVFQVARALGTGIMIYTMALVLSAVVNIPLWQTILLTGIITIIYSYQGGMKAVVYGDVIQMIILLVGIGICIFYGLENIGGWDNFLATVDRSRFTVIDNNAGLSSEEEFGLWPMLIGGFFLYVAYYGCDQSQAQRSLSGKSLSEVRKALMFNGLSRFPITLAYCFMGLIIGAFAMSDAGQDLYNNMLAVTNEHYAGTATVTEPKADLLIPVFITNYLPHGVLGLLLVAILAAAMSSLSSAVNSLSAATVEDLINRYRTTPLTEDENLRYSRILTVLWGAFCILVAFMSAGNFAKTVIEAINKVSSLFNGPILATFLLAIFAKRATTTGMNIGILTGVIVNFILWQTDTLFWIWWNVTGTVVTMTVALLVSAFTQKEDNKINTVLERPELNFLRSEVFILAAFFVFMILFSIGLSEWMLD